MLHLINLLGLTLNFYLCNPNILFIIEDDKNVHGGKRIVKKKGVGIKFYFCKYNEGFGFDKIKTPKSLDLEVVNSTVDVC